MNSKFILIFCIMLLASLGARAADNSFESGNASYRAGQFEAALDFYSHAIQENPQNSSAYYNLGNTAYRMDKLGLARLNFEKALLLTPRDADIRANLHFISQKMDLPSTSQVEQIQKFLRSILSFFTFAEIILLFLLSNALFWFSLTFKKPLYMMGVLSAFFLLITLFVWVDRFQSQWGVVMSPDSPVKSGFLADEKELIKLGAGAKVRVLSEAAFGDQGKWLQVRLPDGRLGWIQSQNLNII